MEQMYLDCTLSGGGVLSLQLLVTWACNPKRCALLAGVSGCDGRKAATGAAPAAGPAYLPARRQRTKLPFCPGFGIDAEDILR